MYYFNISIVKNKMKQPVFVLVALFMLSSCGLKKPLVLPQENTPMVNSIHRIPSEL
jgi:predicted small lipoprotein YifL